MFSDGKYKSAGEWMQANVRDQECGSDFMMYCIDHGIQGFREVYEDYPGGIYYIQEF